MSNSNNSSSSNGIGCLGLTAVLLGVAFVVLKLTGVITWSWLWVLAPFWIYVALSIVLLVLIFGGIAVGALGVGLVKGISNAIKNKKRAKQREAQRLAQAKPLGTFNARGERVKEPYKTHQWML